ncbi:MAG: RnfABCDGE type electron transport complex subunit C [Bacilli bacterium]|nr:RnfABCDGE type electron transport complex subunit C [Bacilli bacterium]
MSIGLKLSGYKKAAKDKLISIYNKPKYVYIPLINCNDVDITVLVKKGDYVLKGAHVGKRKGKIKFPIISTVSGTVIDFVNMPYLNGEEVKCVKIENDFKEKSIENKVVNKIDKKTFLNILQDNSILGMGGAGFPTYIKYSTEKINKLLINAVECEPYITADYVLLKEHTEEILEAIDMIMDINKIDEAFIAVKKTNIELLKVLNNYIGTYLKIKIKEVPNLYPIGWERSLIKEIYNTSYDKFPTEKNIVVNNVSTIFAIYEALKYNKPLTERVVTFTGNIVKKPKNILVKVGSTATDVIKEMLGKEKLKDFNLIAGGPMMGTLSDNDLVITSNLTCVLIMDKQFERGTECMKCGKCVDVCPVKLTPVLIKNSLNNMERLKELQADRCMECGLCSYICPAKLPIREYVKEAKDKIKRGEEV